MEECGSKHLFNSFYIPFDIAGMLLIVDKHATLNIFYSKRKEIKVILMNSIL